MDAFKQFKKIGTLGIANSETYSPAIMAVNGERFVHVRSYPEKLCVTILAARQYVDYVTTMGRTVRSNSDRYFDIAARLYWQNSPHLNFIGSEMIVWVPSLEDFRLVYVSFPYGRYFVTGITEPTRAYLQLHPVVSRNPKTGNDRRTHVFDCRVNRAPVGYRKMLKALRANGKSDYAASLEKASCRA